jgi:hypothetical protein
MFVGLTVPFPPASSINVYAIHTAVGLVVSLTVIVTVQLCEFILVSVTVIVTVWLLISPHTNTDLLNPHVLMLQLSLDPASTVLVVSVTVPMFVSEDKVRYTTVLVHRATGFVVSLTVTTAEQVLVFPLPSVAVSVTV